MDSSKNNSKKSKDFSQEPIELQKISSYENFTLVPLLESEPPLKSGNQEELGQQKFLHTTANGLDTISEDNSPFSVPFWKMPLKQTLSES